MPDPAQALRASAAWNKLLMLQLDVLLAGYVTETPTPATQPPAPDADDSADEPQGMRRVLTNILDGNRANGNADGHSE